MPNQEQLAALSIAAKAAVATEAATKLPAALTLAQWIQESGWGAHSPGNNCFGIKQYPGCPARQLLTTKEWFTPSQVQSFLALSDNREANSVSPASVRNGRMLYLVKDWFAAYPDLTGCFSRHARLITEGRFYSDAWQHYLLDGDVHQLVISVAKVYATDPTYSAKLLTLAGSSDVLDAISSASSAGPVQ